MMRSSRRERVRFPAAALLIGLASGLSAAFLFRAAFAADGPPGRSVEKSPPFVGQTQAAPLLSPEGLRALLRKTAAYCQRLESAAFDFVCREQISEVIAPSFDLDRGKGYQSGDAGSSSASSRGTVYLSGGPRVVRHKYEYDYQCIRSAGTIREVRTLIKENGKAKNEANAELKTSVVVFGTALLSPVGLFGERFQPDYDYAVSGRDDVGQAKVLVIDAHPKPGAPETTNLYGKAWIDPDTGEILKIEWSDDRVGRFEVFRKRGERYGLTPRLAIRSEFIVEKNGVRFPSRLVVEESYRNVRGETGVRSRTEVVYKDFKFFTVEVEVR